MSKFDKVVNLILEADALTKDYETEEQHVDGVLKADIKYPIFVNPDGYIIDGTHRVVKAKLVNKPIKVIRLTPDEIEQTVVQPNEQVVGQTYMSNISGKPKTYSIEKMIQLFENKPAEEKNPDDFLPEIEGNWGNISVHDVLQKASEKYNG